jgi:hypothetical protein
VKEGQQLPKAYEIKVRCYAEHVWQHIGNLGNILGTRWEDIENLKGNTLGTKEKWKKDLVATFSRKEIRRCSVKEKVLFF